MQISVEISMYPLQSEYIAPIDSFLYEMHAHSDLQVVTNVLSTQIFGRSDRVFAALQAAIEKVYGELEQCPFVIKVLKNDVSGNTLKDYK